MAYGYSNTRGARAKQSWQEGDVVNVGFIKGLEVVRKIATPRDGAPDFYVLWNSAKNVFYAFQPNYGGLVRCDDLNDALQAF